METLTLKPIGKVRADDGGMRIELSKEYAPALAGLEGFSHICVLWWFSDFDSPDMRSYYQTPAPYKGGSDVMGTFATRGPVRPNPIALTTVGVQRIDHENGIIEIDWIDAHDQSPVLDIKPYTPSADRVLSATVPSWCAHWPKSLEESEGFNWEEQFNF